MTEDPAGVRGQLWGTHCAGCRTKFTEEDVPLFNGPHHGLNRIAATGWTMTCRYCRQRTSVRPKDLPGQQAELRRAWRALMAELATSLRLPNLARRLGMTPRH